MKIITLTLTVFAFCTSCQQLCAQETQKMAAFSINKTAKETTEKPSEPVMAISSIELNKKNVKNNIVPELKAFKIEGKVENKSKKQSDN